jgi:hypothetical protein
MAMFGGLNRKPKPFLPETSFPGTPGIGGGLPQNQPSVSPAFDPGMGGIPAPMATPAKQGVNWMGVLADTLAGAAGQPGQYAAGLREDKQIERQQAQYRQRLADQQSQWMFQEQWKRDNPAPRSPHYWETNDGSLGVIGPDGKPSIAYKDPTPKIDWITATNADGTKTLVPMQQGGGGPVSPTPGGGSGSAPSLDAGGFMTLGQFKSMLGAPTFKPGHPAWSTPVEITGDADYDSLPSGKTFIGPDRQIRTKP